jgi:hypothetical protein
MINKLRIIGVNETTVRWIEDFLKDRTFRVRVDGNLSVETNATSGVPQGSVLGPILFKIFINDLPCGINSTVAMFADDVLLYREIRGRGDMEAMKRDTEILERWSEKSTLRFNLKKCSHMRFAKNFTYTTAPVAYEMYGTNIKFTSKETYLGLVLESNCRWDANTLKTISKANSVVGLLRRNFSRAPETSKLILYKALVRPILDYCCSICEPNTKESARKLEMAQNRACRFIKADYGWRSSTSTMRKELDLEELVVRRKRIRHKFVEKVLDDKIKVPDLHILKNDLDLIEIKPPIRNRPKRRHYGIFYQSMFEMNDITECARSEIFEIGSTTGPTTTLLLEYV